MTKQGWFALAGYILVIAGAGWIYAPAGAVCAGIVCLRIARHSQRPAGEI